MDKVRKVIFDLLWFIIWRIHRICAKIEKLFDKSR